MNAGDGAQYLPGDEVERVTTQQTQEFFRNSEFHGSGPIAWWSALSRETQSCERTTTYEHQEEISHHPRLRKY